MGAARGDWQAALVSHTIASVFSGKKGRSYKVTDFLIKWGGKGREERQSPADMLTILGALTSRKRRAHGDHR